MRQKKRRSPVGRLIIIFLCVALVFAIVWGVVTALARLTHYGENTTIGSEPEEVQLEETEKETQDIEPALPYNQYDPDGFVENNGIRTYSADGVLGVAGIDVSAYQPAIDWEAVRDAGIEFAMIRVGYRGYGSGKLDLDDCFLSHMQGALDAGLDVGVYFFSQALTPEEATEEANYVITWLEGYEITYPVVFDWEEVEGPARTDQMNMLMLTSCAQAFCETIEEAGYRSAIYFNQAYGYQQLNLVSLQDYVFWLAEYASVPTFAYDFQMWQYTNEGSVPGIEGPVDLNIFFKK